MADKEILKLILRTLFPLERNFMYYVQHHMPQCTPEIMTRIAELYREIEAEPK